MKDTTAGPVALARSVGAARSTTACIVAGSRFTVSASSALPAAPSNATSPMRCAPDEPATPPSLAGSMP